MSDSLRCFPGLKLKPLFLAVGGVAVSACILVCVIPRLLVVSKPLSHADALIVPAGDYQSKMAAVAWMYRDGYAPLILLANDGVFSSWSTKYVRNLYQVEWAEEQLVAMGVPRRAIVRLPFEKSGTFYDMLAAERYLVRAGLKKVILVTMDYHSRRTYWTFRRLTGTHSVETGVYAVSSQSLSSKTVAKEFAKLIYYVIRY